MQQCLLLIGEQRLREETDLRNYRSSTDAKCSELHVSGGR